MDKNELMIGDWVTILKFRENGSNRNVKVNAVGANCILRLCGLKDFADNFVIHI